MEKDCRAFEEACKQKALGLVDEHRREVEDLQEEADREREEWILRELHWVSVLKRRGLQSDEIDGDRSHSATLADTMGGRDSDFGYSQQRAPVPRLNLDGDGLYGGEDLGGPGFSPPSRLKKGMLPSPPQNA